MKHLTLILTALLLAPLTALHATDSLRSAAERGYPCPRRGRALAWLGLNESRRLAKTASLGKAK